LKHSNGKKRVEVSSNEWKRMGVGADLKIKQQCKNLRTNACILHQLNVSCHSNLTEVLAMDFIGNIGYLYMIKKGQNQCLVAKVFATLLIPHNVTNLATLKPTLDAMFRMKVLMKKKKKKKKKIFFS
jgi:hypothetical protein